MMNRQFTNIFLALFFLILTLFVVANTFEPYSLLWLLPFTYTLVFMFFWRFRIGKPLFSSMGDLLFKGAVTIRYLIIPIMIVANGNIHYGYGSYVGLDKYDNAILYMAYELVIISSVYYFLGLNKRKKIQIYDKIPQDNNVILYKILIIFGIGLLILPSIRSRYNFFASDIVKTSREIVATYDESYNFLFYLTNYAKIAIPIVILVYFNRKYIEKQKTVYVMLSIFGTLLPNFFYIATSRNSIFLPLLASFFTMLAIFYKHRGMIYTIYSAGIVSIIGIMTWLKALSGSSNVSLDWLTNYLSIYFLGPKEYAVGLISIDLYGKGITLYTLVNDLISNIPGISVFADLLDRTSQYFNWAYYGGSHIGLGGGYIVPSAIQGAFHFGYIFGPSMIFIAVYTIRWSERLSERHSKNIPTVYMANYAMSAAAFFYANSVSSLLNLMFFIIFPMLIINLIQRLIIRKGVA